MSADIIPFPIPAKADKWQTRMKLRTETKTIGDRAMAYDLLIRLVERLPPADQEEFFRQAHKAAMRAANRREDE